MSRTTYFEHKGYAPPEVEDWLAEARALGLVTVYDRGTGVVWYEGHPGDGLRQLRRRIAAAMEAI